jgi:hypothetical protein
MPKISGALAEVLVGLRMMAVFSRWVGWAVGIGLCVAGLVGCPTTTDCADPRNAETCGKDKVELSVTVSAPVARMRAGETAELGATLERKGEWPSQGEVILSAKDLVGGVTMEPAQVAADATEATLEFVADQAVPQGAFPFTLVATPVDDRIPPAEAPVEAVVPGPPGTLDLSFGGDGEVSISSADVGYYALDLEIDPIGGMIVAGGTADETPILVRVDPSGNVDVAFNEAVQATMNKSFATSAIDAVITVTGVFVLAMKYTIEGTHIEMRQSGVAKYDFQGLPDRAFGKNGSILLDEQFGSSGSSLITRVGDVLIVTPDRIVSLTYDGRINEAFADGGTLSDMPSTLHPIRRDDDVGFLHSATEIWTLTADELAPYPSDLDNLSERISVSDQVTSSTSIAGCDFDSDIMLCVGRFRSLDMVGESWEGAWAARVTADGKLDPTFGSGGVVTRFFAPEADTTNETVASLAGSQFLLLERDRDDDLHYFFARYKPDGSLDPAFGDDGRAEIPPGGVFTHLPIDHVRGRVVVHVVKDGAINITRYWL